MGAEPAEVLTSLLWCCWERARCESVAGCRADAGAAREREEELERQAHVLRMFDLDEKFGPFVGVSRDRRWRRAEKFGLNPPEEVSTEAHCLQRDRRLRTALHVSCII
mmetsp:Transcript_221/g.575  ORF Transcript_221/g.575 Transcript_221/m.575 type:complete len:108 (+) Transcript_221:733-1056(+)